VELIGPYLAAASLLVVAGLAKAVRPRDTARALADLVPLPVGLLVPAVRIGAGAEVVIGAAALVRPGGAPAWLVAVSYAVFTVVVAVARSRGSALATCGCFGTPDTPATLVHVAVDAGCSVAAVVVGLSGTQGSILHVLADQPAHGVPLVVASAVAAWLAYLALSALAALQAARRLAAVAHRQDRWS
jgi:Methylamine utilisation protein MauE